MNYSARARRNQSSHNSVVTLIKSNPLVTLLVLAYGLSRI